MSPLVRSDGSGQRAGLPLARAQRLAAKVDRQSAAAPRAFLILGFLTVATIGAAAVFPVGGIDFGSFLNAEKAEAVPEATAVSQVANDIQAEANVDTPVIIDDLNVPVATACVQAIESQLAKLQTVALTKEQPADYRQVGVLVQNAFDCSDASLKIDGSLELLGTGMANLRVQWNRVDRALHLSMIDQSATAPVADPAVAEGRAIEFVLR